MRRTVNERMGFQLFSSPVALLPALAKQTLAITGLVFFMRNGPARVRERCHTRAMIGKPSPGREVNRILGSSGGARDSVSMAYLPC